jgi:membrane fusion protein, multidrug efflux system
MNLRILGILTSLLVSCTAEHHPKTAELPPLASQAVSVVPARVVNQSVGDEVIGTVHARSVAAISSSIMGNVRALRVTVGSRVRAGEVLVQLSAGEIDAKANQASAMFSQAELDLKRAEQLKASQSIPASRYEAMTAQFRVAEATLAEANVMRGYTTLRAPFAGVITEKRCDVGDLAVPGKPLLVLESPGALRLEAAVPEVIAQVLHRGDVLSARIDSIPQPLSATVSELSPSADPISRTVLVKLDLPNTEALRPGMFGRLSVQTGQERAVVVPTPAVVKRGQMELVFVVKEDKAQLRIVRTGRAHDGVTEVLAGLDGDEPVVVDNAALLVDGQPVEVKP